MKQQKILLAGAAFLLLLGMVDAGSTGSYSVSLGIGNSNPTITYVMQIPAANPTQNADTTILANFTAYDANLVDDLAPLTAQCEVTKGVVTRSSTSCTEHVIDTTSAYYECSIDLHYYDPDGVYNETCSIQDDQAGSASDTSKTFTYNTLLAIGLDKAAMAFGTVSVGTTVASTDNPLIVYNQGNVDISQMDVKAYDLASGVNKVPAENFNATITDGGAGVGTGAPMVNDTYVTVPSLTINRGAGNSGHINLWVAIPPALPSGTYTSVTNWIVAANPV